MNPSEKTARILSKYIVKLVRRLPFNYKKLFDEDLVVFCVEDDGSLMLSIAEDLPEHIQRGVRKAVAKYMNTHPCPVLGEKDAAH